MSKRDKKQLQKKWHQRRQELAETRFDDWEDTEDGPTSPTRPEPSSTPSAERTEKGLPWALPAGTVTATLPAGSPGSEVKPSPVSDSDEVYTKEEVCKLLKLSRSTVDRMSERGELPGRFKLGGQVRFHGATLRQFLRSKVSSIDAL